MEVMTEIATPPESLVAIVRVIDLETTGNSFTDGGVVEIGWQDVVADADGWRLSGPPGACLVRPGNPISPATSAIHHIVDEDVADAPSWHAVAPGVLCSAPPPIVLAAHRASFEQRWCLPALSGHAQWICTYKCALRLWPEAPGHSNQGLRYWRRPQGLDRTLGMPAHRAGPDAYVTAHHLRDMLALTGVAQLLAWSAEPALLARVPYGASRGRRWADIDEAALLRILEGDDGGNVDLLFTARTERDRRCGLPPTLPTPGQLSLGLAAGTDRNHR
ncbi:exonuclease domain-containing protein [Lichenicoccus sp.]|uniref:exonuclease domain-containing protein n=1 Tax=Lichenicoccus sp. TaxID=2781899 RepID=UPI003D0EF200